MPRTIEICLPPELTEKLLREISDVHGLIGLRCERGASLQPPGDLITVTISNKCKTKLMHLLDAHGIGQSAASSITMSSPSTVISAAHSGSIVGDSSEATWEEMESMMARESNMSINALAVMLISGMVAAAGIASNSLHIVIGAMLIAPGFEPITRIGLGLVSGSGWRQGLIDLGKGYAALVSGAVLATWIGQLVGKQPATTEPTYFAAGTLMGYWTNVTFWSVFVSAVASAAGALLVASSRSVLTGGVMVALALVPSAAIVGMSLPTARWDLLRMGLLRWGLEALLVVTAAVLVFGAERLFRARRRSVL